MRINFLIVGAQKAGTTALSSFLAQHPELCVAHTKEAHLFDAADYQAAPGVWDQRHAQIFPDYRGQRWVGEATPIYMYLPFVAERICLYNPGMRLIALLRNPAERAISHYKMELARGVEPLPLGMALASERFRLWRDRNNLAQTSSVRVHSYVARGFYSRQLQGLLRYFPREQLLVLKMDDLLHRHADTLNKVYRFLDVETPEELPEPRHVRPALGDGLIERHVEPSAPVRLVLKRIYRREIARLEELLGWNLDDWR